MDNTCICCGSTIPEGHMVCLICEENAYAGSGNGSPTTSNTKKAKFSFFRFLSALKTNL